MKTSRLSLAVIAGATVFLWAVPPHAGGANPGPRTSARQDPGTPATAGNGLASPVSTADLRESSGGELNLRQALELALAGNPDLVSFPWEVRSGDARIRQAGLRPNPELTVDLENFLGSDPSRKFETLETTLSISQLMELSGKRAARIRLASSEKEVSRWDYEAKRADVAAEMEQREATLAQERANRISDVTFSGGVRRSREANVTSFVFGAAVPLPIFHRNQGKILESQYRISKAEREREAAGNKVLAALSDAYQALATGYAEATTLKSAVIPGAQSAFEATSEGFRQGKFGYLEVLDAQRTLFEARGRYVESLGAYHKAVADTERLIGGELGEPVKSIGTK